MTLNAQERVGPSASTENVPSSQNNRTADYVLGGIVAFVVGLLFCFCICKITEGMGRRRKAYEAILCALPDLALVLDGQGQHIEMLTQKTDPNQDLKRNLLSQILSPEHFVKLMASVKLALETGYVQNLNLKAPLTTGETWFAIQIAPLEKPPEKARSALVLIRNTTPQKRAEESARSTEKKSSGTYRRMRARPPDAGYVS